MDDSGYIVITPAFNEAENIPQTIASMIAQSVKPELWVIVDDGSTDGTYCICENAASDHDWLHVIQNDEKKDQAGDGLLSASEARAFLRGYEYALLQYENPGFVVKLDADLEFGPNYFSELLGRFKRDASLGLAGGVVYEYCGDELVEDRVSSAHVRGATKMYRSQCYNEIGGVWPVFGWDAIDELIARDKGWRVSSFSDVQLVHLRRTASRLGRFRGWSRNGYMAYYIGMSIGRVVLRSVFRLVCVRDPVQAAGLFWGFFRAWVLRQPRLGNENILKLVKRNQWHSAVYALKS